MSMKQIAAMLTHLSDQLDAVAATVRRVEKARQAAAKRKVKRPSATARRSAASLTAEGLPPRLTQVLAGLLDGLGEKQIAFGLGISPHTVHVYVKALHKRYGVSARCELLSLFIHRPIETPEASRIGPAGMDSRRPRQVVPRRGLR